MSKNSETGYAINVANMQKLIENCIGFGTSFNPSNALLTISALQTLYANSKTANETVDAALSTWKTAVSARVPVFNMLSPLVTRVLNALKVSGASSEICNTVESLARKLRGQRSSAKPKQEEKTEETTSSGTHSSSQMGFDNRLDNFHKFIKQLEIIPEYAPNEEDLKIAALQALHADMATKNQAVVIAQANLQNARIARDKIFFEKPTGLADIAVNVKLYVKSIFGAASPQYKTVSSLKFTRK